MSAAGRYRKAADIKVGVIGYGGSFNMGKGHLDQAREAGMTPLAVTEIDPARREQAVADFPGIEVYGSTAAMLRKSAVDLVAIITPHNTHARLALQCLRGGRHVVCEKPFAIKTTECDAMIREARKRDLVVSTYHNRHWDGCILEAVKHVRKREAIGDIVRVTAHMGGYGYPLHWWRSSKKLSGGVLYDWGVHMLEYSLQLIDGEIADVTGYAHRGFWAEQSPWGADTIEDEASAVVRFRNGAVLFLTVSHIDANGGRTWIEVTGTRGTYKMNWNGYELIRRVRKQSKTTTGENPPSQWQRYYRDLCDHLVKGTPLTITPEWARRPIHILDLADQSVRRKQTIKAKYR